MKVQFLNWVGKDIVSQSKSSEGYAESKFVIFGFGRSNSRLAGGQHTDGSVCVVFHSFKPYFYFLAEDESGVVPLAKVRDFIETKFSEVRDALKHRPKSFALDFCRRAGLPYFQPALIDDLEKMEEHHSHIFMGKGFENFRKRRFIKVFFKTQRAFKYFQHFIPFCEKSFQIYEGNINPMLKMFHDQQFSPSSWLEFSDQILVPKNEFSKLSKADVEYSVHYGQFAKNIRVVPENNSLWFKLCSFDIECDSSHGDYPLSKKQFAKLNRELKALLQGLKKREITDPAFLSRVVSALNECACAEVPASETPQFSRLYLKKIPDNITRHSDEHGETRYCSPLDDEISRMLVQLFHTKNYDAFEEFLKSMWGPVQGDPIIQIGNIIEYPKGTYKKVIFCLRDTRIDDNPDIIVRSFDTETQVLTEWCKWIECEDPDILMGYNIYNFDNEYIWNRADELGITHIFNRLSRLDNEETTLVEMTKGTGKYFTLHGREMIDLMDYVKKNYSLDSYSLDNVSAKFIRGRISKIENDEVHITSKPIGLQSNDFFKIYVNNGIYEDKLEHQGRTKFKIKSVHDTKIILSENLDIIVSDFILEWCLSKDDILPKQIFEYQKGTSAERGLIAKYCIQDCMLCHYIFQKLEVLVNNMAMSNVCFVPFGYLFLRGQSVKIFSLIAKQCAQENYRIPVLKPPEDISPDGEESAESYEGALVLDPQTGIYINDPVSVNDFNSLYPSCGIAENISPDTHVLDPQYLNVPGFSYNSVVFDELEYRQLVGKSGRVKKNKEAVRVGSRTCVFAVFPNGEKGILPKIWAKLLQERKDTRKRMESETDAFRKTLLDGLQLAFKTTANSMYGIFGFRKSPLFYQDVAASITACGRKNLMLAKEFIETQYPGSRIIYGDTDSLFVSYPSKLSMKSAPQEFPVSELDLIYESIDTATEAGERVSALLKKPHNLGFEKCVSPFILMARKRYTGLYYTSKSPKKYMNTMGFALKRRDNALLVKEIVGNAIKKILFEKDILGSVKYVQDSIMDMLEGKFPIEKFIITKTLRGSYVCPEQISHYVLSLKMAERDPGNRPKVGDRIPFVFVKTPNANAKQSERIESPKYILENGCAIDYMYYLTNQLMNPLTQVYSLVYHNDTENIVFSKLVRRAYQLHQNMSSIPLLFSMQNKSQMSVDVVGEPSSPRKPLSPSSSKKGAKRPGPSVSVSPRHPESSQKKITTFFAVQTPAPLEQ